MLIEDDRRRSTCSRSRAPSSRSATRSICAVCAYKVAAGDGRGKSYSLPFDSGVTGLFYRSDYLRAGRLQGRTTCRTSPGTSSSRSARTSRPRPAIRCSASTTTSAASIRMMLQSAGQWYFNQDGSLESRRQSDVEGLARELARDLDSRASSSRSPGWANFTGSFTSGDVAAVPVGVWITGTIKANARPSPASGPLRRFRSSPAFRRPANASNWGGSSWYVLAKSPEQGRRDRLPQDGLGERRRLLPEDPGRTRRRRHAARRAHRRCLAAKDDVLRRPAGLAGLLRLARARFRRSDYGIFTTEVDAAVVAQLPTIAKGGSVDDAIKAINEQAAVANPVSI